MAPPTPTSNLAADLDALLESCTKKNTTCSVRQQLHLDTATLQAKITALEATITAKDAEIAGAKSELKQVRSQTTAEIDPELAEQLKAIFAKETALRESTEKKLVEKEKELKFARDVADTLDIDSVCHVVAGTARILSARSGALRLREKTLQATEQAKKNVQSAKHIVEQAVAPALIEVQALRNKRLSVDERDTELARLCDLVSRLTQTMLDLAENSTSCFVHILDRNSDICDSEKAVPALEWLQRERVTVGELNLAATERGKQKYATSGTLVSRMDHVWGAVDCESPFGVWKLELNLAHGHAIRKELSDIVQRILAANNASEEEKSLLADPQILDYVQAVCYRVVLDLWEMLRGDTIAKMMKRILGRELKPSSDITVKPNWSDLQVRQPWCKHLPSRVKEAIPEQMRAIDRTWSLNNTQKSKLRADRCYILRAALIRATYTVEGFMLDTHTLPEHILCLILRVASLPRKESIAARNDNASNENKSSSQSVEAAIKSPQPVVPVPSSRTTLGLKPTSSKSGVAPQSTATKRSSSSRSSPSASKKVKLEKATTVIA